MCISNANCNIGTHPEGISKTVCLVFYFRIYYKKVGSDSISRETDCKFVSADSWTPRLFFEQPV